ncbi:hypothetical protein ACLOJK_013305 [Asimina triloba]
MNEKMLQLARDLPVADAADGQLCAVLHLLLLPKNLVSCTDPFMWLEDGDRVLGSLCIMYLDVIACGVVNAAVKYKREG